MEERKKRMADRKTQRKEDRRNAYYRQKEEEAQRIHEEQLKKGNVSMFAWTPPTAYAERKNILLLFVSLCHVEKG